MCGDYNASEWNSLDKLQNKHLEQSLQFFHSKAESLVKEISLPDFAKRIMQAGYKFLKSNDRSPFNELLFSTKALFDSFQIGPEHEFSLQRLAPRNDHSMRAVNGLLNA